jgi:hypothetical protein
MARLIRSKIFKRFGIAYLVYEAVSLVGTILVGAQILHIG